LRRWLLTFLCLAGCGAGSSALEDETGWAFEPLDSGAKLTALDATGPVLQLSCAGASDRLTLQVFRFAPLASDQPLTFGTPDESVAFTVDPATPGRGVVARASGTYPMLISLLSEGTVSAQYGEQSLGPLVYSAEAAEAFAGACSAR
jgi:hypothetical protein